MYSISELEKQYNNLSQHMKTNSSKARTRYGSVFRRFLRFISQKYDMNNLCDISQKHILEYVQYMQHAGYSMASINFQFIDLKWLYNNIAYTRKILPVYENIDLRCRSFGGSDKRWTDYEYEVMWKEMWQIPDKTYFAILMLARYAGLHINECFRISKYDVEAGYETRKLPVTDKNGMIRYVPCNYMVKGILPRIGNQKMLFTLNETIESASNHLQYFVEVKRKIFTNAEITLDGLRHNYALEQYTKLIKKGLSSFDARIKVVEYLGNPDDEITKLYLPDSELE